MRKCSFIRGKVMDKSEVMLSYTETTRDVRVTVFPQFLEGESSPENRIYAFAYTITIENFSSETVQLLSRHWLINSGGANYTEVRGDGVVGEQPVLEFGDAFQYVSGAVIKDPVGSMHGTYTFRGETGENFEVVIPKFDLIYPKLIH